MRWSFITDRRRRAKREYTHFLIYWDLLYLYKIFGFKISIYKIFFYISTKYSTFIYNFFTCTMKIPKMTVNDTMWILNIDRQNISKYFFSAKRKMREKFATIGEKLIYIAGQTGFPYYSPFAEYYAITFLKRNLISRALCLCVLLRL